MTNITPGTGDTVTRPDGRAYKSRKVIAYPVVDGDELPSGVMILGTHDISRAMPLAQLLTANLLDSGYKAVDPVTGWWRDGFEGGRRAWVNDPEAGRAGVWFREIVERNAAASSSAATAAPSPS